MSISKNIATKAVLVGGILLAGCGLTNRDFTPGMTFGKEREKTEARFFVGSDWIDANRNRHIEKDEMYHQSEFGLKDKLTIIADLKGYEGELTTRIWNGKTGHIVKTTKTQLSPRTLVEYTLKGFDLYHRPFGGEGKYYVAWYIGDELMKREDFSIKK